MLRLQLVRREKRGLELQEAALRAQGPVHMLLLEQLQWERAQLQTRGANSSGGGSSGGSSGDEEPWSQVSGSAGPLGLAGHCWLNVSGQASASLSAQRKELNGKLQVKVHTLYVGVFF